MIDSETVKKAEELMQKYEYNWGKKVDMRHIPSGMSQDKFVEVMERIVETGESVLVGWNKCFLYDNHENVD